MTPASDDLARLQKQNALLFRALTRLQARCDDLTRQLAERDAALAALRADRAERVTT